MLGLLDGSQFMVQIGRTNSVLLMFCCHAITPSTLMEIHSGWLRAVFVEPNRIWHLVLVQGLLFYHTCKVGLGIGFKWGSGILIAHLQDEEGTVSWSAPCLFKIKEASLGLLAGMHFELGTIF